MSCHHAIAAQELCIDGALVIPNQHAHTDTLPGLLHQQLPYK